MYERLKEKLLTLLKAPQHPPDAPAGSHGSIQIFRAAPNYLKYQVFIWGGGFMLGLIAETVLVVSGHANPDGKTEVILGYVLVPLTILAAVIKYFLIRIDYDMRYYVVTDRSLRIREGALIINETTFTYANVQNLRILQGPIERLLGLANLVVETAGGAGQSSEKRGGLASILRAGHEGVLRGVGNAREVRDQIQGLLKQYRDAGLGDPEDRHRTTPDGAAGTDRGVSPAAVERLREIRAELQRLDVKES